jgi:hypothetical protein
MGASVAAAIPRPIGVGPEMAALGRFYRDVTWKGTIHEGGMGPGTPAMTGVGRGKIQAIQDGRWIVLDCEQDQFLLDGTFVLTWQLHSVSGWSPEHGEYRAVMTDNYCHAGIYRGRIDGDRVVFESLAGEPARLRFTWDASDPGVIIWRNEMSIDERSWFLIGRTPGPGSPASPRRPIWRRSRTGPHAAPPGRRPRCAPASSTGCTPG